MPLTPGSSVATGTTGGHQASMERCTTSVMRGGHLGFSIPAVAVHKVSFFNIYTHTLSTHMLFIHTRVPTEEDYYNGYNLYGGCIDPDR